MNLYTKYNRVISTSAVYSEHKRVLTFQNISQVVDVDPAVLDTDTRPGWGNEPSGTNTQTDTQTDTQNTHTLSLSLSLSLCLSLSLFRVGAWICTRRSVAQGDWGGAGGGDREMSRA